MTLLNTLSRFLPASRCELCGSVGNHAMSVCFPCLQDLPHNGNCCSQCGRALPESAPVCGNCINQDWLADRTEAAFQYRYPLDILIKKLKYHQCLRLTRPLAEALASRLAARDALLLPEVMVPVPLHWMRLYTRGFNQSVEVCRILQPRLAIGQDLDLVERIRNTAPMIDLSANDRSKNIRGAFKLKRRLPYRSIAIVDDVITSGATVSELARLFRLAGAEHVEFWALARAE